MIEIVGPGPKDPDERCPGPRSTMAEQRPAGKECQSYRRKLSRETHLQDRLRRRRSTRLSLPRSARSIFASVDCRPMPSQLARGRTGPFSDAPVKTQVQRVVCTSSTNGTGCSYAPITVTSRFTASRWGRAWDALCTRRNRRPGKHGLRARPDRHRRSMQHSSSTE